MRAQNVLLQCWFRPENFPSSVPSLFSFWYLICACDTSAGAHGRRSSFTCNEDGFDTLPDKVRRPWQASREGLAVNLKLHYRRLLAEQGFCIVWARPSIFRPEQQ
jgi:hypothetical protein